MPQNPTGPDGPAAAPTTWAAWRGPLLDAVLTLRDDEGLTVEAPQRYGRMARPVGTTLFSRLAGARKRRVVPAVRLHRVEDHLRGYWTGAEAHGGPFPWTDDETAAAQALGWHRPTVTDGEDFVKFWPDDVPQGPYLPLDDARRATEVVERTFREVLGVTDEPGEDGEPPELPAVVRDDA
ncbi:TY-Chap domain-containing protein [Phycicoccus flavus]|uniref:TY-Chap domain-containing protein n=1 Tax=Phycicoccus flavus TaxID=2502783 RepID=UPI000FEBCB9F|nr:hypothetical protein [Phycicoccus flavus]NHA69225.1 hypothetical protein [Phycicoccus flavus]